MRGEVTSRAFGPPIDIDRVGQKLFLYFPVWTICGCRDSAVRVDSVFDWMSQRAALCGTPPRYGQLLMMMWFVLSISIMGCMGCRRRTQNHANFGLCICNAITSTGPSVHSTELIIPVIMSQAFVTEKTEGFLACFPTRDYQGVYTVLFRTCIKGVKYILPLWHK